MLVCRMRLLGVLSFLSASCPSKKLSQKAPQHAHRQFILQPATTSLEMPRRSARIRALHASSSSQGNDGEEKRKTKKTRTVPQKKDQKVTRVSSLTLPRTLEFKAYQDSNFHHVIGIDEAGRGPLAGPVVAAAVIYPKDTPPIEGITDSKRITKEEEREELYEQLIAVPNIRWAVSIIDAKRIDEINILQATLEGMRSAALCLADPKTLTIRIAKHSSAKEIGSYVICSESSSGKKSNNGKMNHDSYFSLIDGNKVPKDMPCEAKAVVKGDSKEFVIAAASIFAKVTRDRLMHEYDKMYPEFNLSQHKGYPTKAHIASIVSNGVSPIHRLTFAPLKNMNLTERE